MAWPGTQNRSARCLPAQPHALQPQQSAEEGTPQQQQQTIPLRANFAKLGLHRQSTATQAESSQLSQQQSATHPPAEQHQAQPLLTQLSVQEVAAKHSGRQSSAQQLATQQHSIPQQLPHSSTQPHSTQQQSSEQDSVAVLHDFMCERPDGAMVVRDLSMQLGRGQWALITGRSGSGKTTLVQALAGLWPHWQGHCQLPSADQVCQ